MNEIKVKKSNADFIFSKNKINRVFNLNYISKIGARDELRGELPIGFVVVKKDV